MTAGLPRFNTAVGTTSRSPIMQGEKLGVTPRIRGLWPRTARRHLRPARCAAHHLAAAVVGIGDLGRHARSEVRKQEAATLPTSSMVKLRRSGALRSTISRMRPKLLMPEEASVLIGPAECH